MNNAVQPAAPSFEPLPRLLDVPEVATHLRVSSRFVWSLVARGRIPSIRVRRRVLVRREALEQIIAHGLPAQ